jgi:hypothetical protein
VLIAADVEADGDMLQRRLSAKIVASSFSNEHIH